LFCKLSLASGFIIGKLSLCFINEQLIVEVFVKALQVISDGSCG
jgi:hypothetical protein